MTKKKKNLSFHFTLFSSSCFPLLFCFPFPFEKIKNPFFFFFLFSSKKRLFSFHHEIFFVLGFPDLSVFRSLIFFLIVLDNQQYRSFHGKNCLIAVLEHGGNFFSVLYYFIVFFFFLLLFFVLFLPFFFLFQISFPRIITLKKEREKEKTRKKAEKCELFS